MAFIKQLGKGVATLIFVGLGWVILNAIITASPGLSGNVVVIMKIVYGTAVILAVYTIVIDFRNFISERRQG